MICGLLERDGGEVTVAGQAVDVSAVDAKAAIGYVPQDPVLLSASLMICTVLLVMQDPAANQAIDDFYLAPQAVGEALEDFEGRGRMLVHGETWRVHCAGPVRRGDRLAEIARVVVDDVLGEVAGSLAVRIVGEELLHDDAELQAAEGREAPL